MPETDRPQLGYNQIAANMEDTRAENREKAAADAKKRNLPVSHKADPGPQHKFKLKFKELEETITVRSRHKGQAEIEARAIFNDRIAKAVKRIPGPREVECTAA